MISEMSLGEYIKQSKGKLRSKFKTGKPSGLKPKKTPAANPESAPRPIKKLLSVNNLPKSVTNDELNKIFGKLGTLSRCNVLYDAVGQSKVF
jgi:RNA recognition motif-containing protein